MHIPVLILQWLVTIADAIIYGVVTFFGLIFFDNNQIYRTLR